MATEDQVFIVDVRELNTYAVKAKSEAEIRHWHATEGAQWPERHGADLLECHDDITNVETE